MTSAGYDSKEFYSFKAISTDGVFMLMGQIEGPGMEAIASPSG